MRFDRRYGASVAALTAFCVLAATTAVAQAGGPPPPPDRVFREGAIQYVKTRVGPSDSGIGIQVPCRGKRWNVVGGGADVVEGFAPAVYLIQSHPFDWNAVHGGDADERPDDGWDVFLREEAGPDLVIEAWAICLKRGVRYRIKSQALGMGEGRTVRSSCRRDQVLGGGFLNSHFLTTEVSVSTPYDGPDRRSRRDDGWAIHGFNHTGTDARVYANAICGRDDDLKYPSKAAPAPSILTTRSPQVRCGRKAHVTAGGGSVGSGHVVESHPIDGGDRGKAPDDGWRTTLLTAAGFQTRTFAICRG